MSIGARESGKSYMGGKSDDITVLVAAVISNQKLSKL